MCFGTTLSRCSAIPTVFISYRSSILLNPLPPSLLFAYSLSTSLTAWSTPANVKSCLVCKSQSLISFLVQSAIAVAGPIIGTANELCTLGLFNSFSSEFQIFFTLDLYSLITLSLFSGPRIPTDSSIPKYL